MNTNVDVNAAFAQERADQITAAAAEWARVAARGIDSGKLIPLGNDRYKVNEPGSYDDGEVWTLRNGTIQPQTDLDVSTGQAALYTNVPAWHELGHVADGTEHSIGDVLQLGRIDFEITKEPVRYLWNGVLREIDGQYVTVRSDLGNPLGVVGEIYTPIQNREQFEFLEDLTATSGAVWESAGALRGGRRVFVSMRLPASVQVDVKGINDEIVPFIVAMNSHDGSSQAQVVVTPWRPVCGNTERFALRDAHTRWGVRHTRNAMQRLDEARRTLKLSSDYFAEYAADEQALAETNIKIAEFEAVLNDLWTPPDADASKREKTMAATRTDQLIKYWADNTARLGTTAYAAERAITEYADWGKGIAPRRELRGKNLAARATMMLEGTEDALKSKAHQRLLTLTNH